MNQIKHIFVTGGTGLLGKDLVPSLLASHYTVHLLIRHSTLVPFPSHLRLIIHHGDVTNLASLKRSLRGCQAIVHLAANKYHPVHSYTVNVGGAENLKQAMLACNVTRLINISTQATKIKHKGVYGLTKLQSDQILHDPKIFQVTTLKPSLVYGQDQGSLFQTIAHYVKKLPAVPVFGNGRWIMYPIWVHDVSQAIIRCLKNPQTIGKTYDLGCSTKITMNQLIDLISQTLNQSTRKLHIPVPLGLLGARFLRLFSDNPPITIDNVLGSTQPTYCRPLRAIKELKLNPVSITEGVKRIFRPTRLPDVIKVAIVGLGKMGLLHTAIVNLLPQAHIVALIDSNSTLRQTAQTLGVSAPVYSSLSQATAQVDIDLVFICTPTYTHLSLAQWCLNHQLHIFIEKPVTTNFSDTQKLLQLSRRHPKLIIGTGYYYRYRPLYRQAKKLLRQGILGKLGSFSATVLHSEVFGPKRGWLFDPQKSGGGVLINPTPHALSVLIDYFGLPQQVVCTTKQLYSTSVEDEAQVKFSYKHNFTGQLHASWSKPGVPVLQTTLKVEGQRGQLILTSDKLILKLKSHRPTTMTLNDVISPDTIINLNPAQGAEGYYLQDQDMVKAILHQHQPRSNLAFAAKVERLVSVCYQSARTHQSISL